MLNDDTKIAKILAEARDQYGKVFGVMAAVSMAGFAVSEAARLEGNDELAGMVDELIAATLGMMHDDLAPGEFTREEFAGFMMSRYYVNYQERSINE